ncbi:hypothetical protein N7532_004334 [Penicillium argentinense]|uniref:Nicotinamide N-methyltransferase n=1 Tax=Penicillium argentinense TaxID=1131581 RepID=A0A9W9FPQ5_9EURO|nr:uncharacterized protein N7532_004334 [Penicillium argentinense]KAJ5103805.1 hypothetical protein N7532_004334 [Penicillium argentinense]
MRHFHSRLRPLPRRQPITTAVPAPDFQDEDEDRNVEAEDLPENLFESFMPFLFPEDTPPFHGDPGQHLLYASPQYGDLEIMVPSYPEQGEKSKEVAAGQDGRVEEGRKLFAHFLWSAAMVVAEGIEDADSFQINPTDAKKDAYDIWNVKGESIMELGAGTALPSLVAALAGASTVAATDHPSSPAFTGAMKFNMEHNLRNRTPAPATVAIEPHAWGVLDDTFSQKYKGTFTRIIAADCYWMRSQHENLARTMQWFLAPGGKVWVIAGFHTSRAVVTDFFETAYANGFESERIFERDVVQRDENDGEIRREWRPVREDEGPENRQRWVVVSVLRRKE